MYCSRRCRLVNRSIEAFVRWSSHEACVTAMLCIFPCASAHHPSQLQYGVLAANIRPICLRKARDSSPSQYRAFVHRPSAPPGIFSLVRTPRLRNASFDTFAKHPRECFLMSLEHLQRSV